jgi:hypothetical protein
VKHLKLIRYAHRTTHTLGMLHLDGEFLMYTLELPNRYNRTYVSRIPIGEYLCVPDVSPNKGDVYMVLHVPGRTNILIHTGNWVEDTEGCILLGIGQGDDMVGASVAAMDKLEYLLCGESFKLRISNLEV